MTVAKAFFDAGLYRALRDAGLANNNTTRVVIDIRLGHIPVVHTEQLGETTVIDVVRHLGGVEVQRIDGQPQGPTVGQAIGEGGQ